MGWDVNGSMKGSRKVICLRATLSPVVVRDHTQQGHHGDFAASVLFESDGHLISVLQCGPDFDTPAWELMEQLGGINYYGAAVERGFLWPYLIGRHDRHLGVYVESGH
jgi:hypothetical protein